MLDCFLLLHHLPVLAFHGEAPSSGTEQRLQGPVCQCPVRCVIGTPQVIFITSPHPLS